MPVSVIERLLTTARPCVMASPFVEERWALRALGLPPETDGLPCLMTCAQRLGCELIYFAEGGVDYNQALGAGDGVQWQTHTTTRSDGLKVIRTRLHTPKGDLTSESLRDDRSEDPANTRTESLMKTEQDYTAFHWYLERIEEDLEALIRQKKDYVAAKVAAVGNWGLVCSEGPVSAGLQGVVKREDLIWHRMEFPGTVLATIRRLHRVEQALMIAALDAGARMFRFCVEGRERFTRDVFETDMEPFLSEDIGLLKARGALTYIHTCGHLKDQIKWGYLNRLKPHLVESFSAPPEGDIDDLRWAREMLEPSICTRGNVSLTLLRNGQTGQIAEAVDKILTAVQGYRHIVSGTDAVHAGTPFQNIEALVKAIKP